MTHVEQLALAVQASVLDRLARQLAAVEGAIVRVEALVSDAAEDSAVVRELSEPTALGREGASEVDGSPRARTEDQEGWTTVFEADVPASVGESPRVPTRDPGDRWSAPMQPRRREPIRASEPSTGSRTGEPLRMNEKTSGAAALELASESIDEAAIETIGTRSVAARESRRGVESRQESASEPESLRGQTSESATVSESIREATSLPSVASEPIRMPSEAQTDRWSRPLRPAAAIRREDRASGTSAAAPAQTNTEHASITTRSRASESTPTIRPGVAPPIPADPALRSDPRPRTALDPQTPASEPSEPLQLPAPLRLPDDLVFDRSARAPDPGSNPRRSDRPREFGRASLARPAAHARELAELADARIREPSLDDEFDELSRLEERMADVLERVMLEIGVEP